MIQSRAFDPDSGAPLEDAKDFPPGTRRGRDQGRRPVQEHPLAVTDDWVDRREGSMTNGELVSSTDGLLGYFRRAHRQVREPAPALDRAAALAIKRVKRATNSQDEPIGEHALDVVVWYVTAERLARKGHWTAWMLDHAIPRCPHCRSALKFRPAVDGLEGVCASSPNRHGAVDDAIRDRIRELYRHAFDDAVDELVLF